MREPKTSSFPSRPSETTVLEVEDGVGLVPVVSGRLGTGSWGVEHVPRLKEDRKLHQKY